MRTTGVAMVIVALFMLAFGQVQHAPTVAQCQADQRLWFSKVEAGDSPTSPSYDVLSSQEQEMLDCIKVDPSNQWRYDNTAGELEAVQSTRVIDFLKRHDLWDKFKAEDAAGKR